MKKNQLVLLAALAVVGLLIGACTRSASGSPSEVTGSEESLPNPVSTQSQVMKDIIAGTQTAMAIPLDATPGEGTEVAADDEEVATDETPEPDVKEPTAVPLPTSTAGPPPAVELTYNTKLCANSDCDTSTGQVICCCILEYTKDQNVTIQVSNPFFASGTEVKFSMAPEGQYDLSKYVLAGIAEYKPAGDGNFFKAVINIPDSLRGTGSILVRVDTENPKVFTQNYFANK